MGNMKDRKALIFCGECKQWHVAEYDCKNEVMSFRSNAPVSGNVAAVTEEKVLDLTPFIEKMDVGDVSVTRMVGGVEISLIDRDGFGHSYEMLDSEFYDAMLNQIIQRPTTSWGLIVGAVLSVVVWCAVIAGVI